MCRLPRLSINRLAIKQTLVPLILIVAYSLVVTGIVLILLIVASAGTRG